MLDNYKGLVHIYTGTGKGKSTAAIGLSVRALGHGLSVCWASFMKRPKQYGYTELDSLEKLGASVYTVTSGHPRFNKLLSKDLLMKECVSALDFLASHCQQNSCNMLVMDEVLVAVRDSFLDESCLIDFIANKPSQLELVLTGRGATNALVAMADYVSVIDAVRHPAQKGVASREGIEY